MMIAVNVFYTAPVSLYFVVWLKWACHITYAGTGHVVNGKYGYYCVSDFHHQHLRQNPFKKGRVAKC